MSTTKDSDRPTAPTPPSSVEAMHFYYGLYSKPRLIARSSTYLWIEPRGPEAYLRPKELSPFGFGHPLEDCWEDKVGPQMISYLDDIGVKASSLDPVRIGYAGDSSPPAIIWVGVLPGTLAPEAGVNVAIQCKNILSSNGINDVDVELRESSVFRSARLYKPVPTSVGTVRVIEPFSTALGLPISTEARPTLFLVTARHVVIQANRNDNELVKCDRTNQPRRKVLLFSESAAEKHLKDIASEIRETKNLIEQLQMRLNATATGRMEPAYAKRETDIVIPLLKEADEAIKDLQAFLPDVTRDLDWKDPKKRVIGHVFLSPPIACNVGDSGFTEDWAVVKVDASKINATNFVGNVIDLGIDVTMQNFTSWMFPQAGNPPSFKYPGNRLHELSGFIPDEEMWKSDPKILGHDNDPAIMVMKRGHATGLTVGQLNTMRSFARYYFDDEFHLPKDDVSLMMSKEVSVLPRNSKSGPFSEPGDSGSSVVDGKGRIAGLMTGGAGDTNVSDCTVPLYS
ncbi:hypothetical protein F5887DRAFT_993030 [Amanita rubescens]|nr:hypothetical protein F5887DRAFT_993030 [Amanita rubescens]